MSRLHREIICSFLRWERRIELAEPGITHARIGLPLALHLGKDRSATSAPYLSEVKQNRALRGEFAEHVLQTHRQWSREDTDAACAHLYSDYCRRGLLGLYGGLCHALDLDVAFQRGEPVIALKSAFDWIAALDLVDQDSIIAYAYVADPARPADDIETLHRWGLSARIADDVVEAVLARGVADMHVHLGGIRSASILWHSIGLGALPLRKVPRYAPAALAKIDDPRVQLRRRRERDRINAATGLGHQKLRALRAPRPPRPHLMAKGADTVRALLWDEIREERLMLARAFRQLQTGFDAELEAQLDAYLHAKAVFIASMQQPIDTNPGLGAFRSYFRNVRPSWGESRPPPARFAYSPRLAERALAEYGVHLEQSRGVLQRAELRMAPLASPVEYERFFKSWAKVETAFDIESRDLRFAIHFKRSADNRKGKSAEADHVTLAREVDRESRELYCFLTNRAFKHGAKIARIDLAGQERDGSPLAAAFAIRLLRGEPRAIEQLQSPDIDPIVHRFWLLQGKRRALAPREPRLGLTCHAGEDFFHPVEGLFSMDMALKMLGMQRGDSIGHGLAAGWDLKLWDKMRRQRRYAPQGAVFDALLWLDIVNRMTLRPSPDALKHYLDQAFTALYGTARRPDLSALFNLRAGPIHNRAYAPSDPIDALRWAECWDSGTVKARAKKTPLPEFLSEIIDDVRAAQTYVLKAMSAAGVVVELNPSSNARVAGTGHIEDAPFVALLGSKTLAASVNTDDPGTFGTRIENEFALAYAAMREARPVADAKDRLEEIRFVGLGCIR